MRVRVVMDLEVEEVETGGGCLAMSLGLGKLGYVLLTDDSGVGVPADGEVAYVGVHLEDGSAMAMLSTDARVWRKEGLDSAPLVVGAAVKAFGAVVRFVNSVGPMEVVAAAYGDSEVAEGSPRSGYLRGKAELLARRGVGFWWGELDLGSRRRLVEAALRRYGMLDGEVEP